MLVSVRPQSEASTTPAFPLITVGRLSDFSGARLRPAARFHQGSSVCYEEI